MVDKVCLVVILDSDVVSLVEAGDEVIGIMEDFFDSVVFRDDTGRDITVENGIAIEWICGDGDGIRMGIFDLVSGVVPVVGEVVLKFDGKVGFLV